MRIPGPKKPRGWKRRMRELERWIAAERAPLAAHHLDAGYHSEEVWFERWPHPFPIGVRRRIVQHLVEVHDRWLARLPELGEELYLGIWLFEPGIDESQVVVAAAPCAADYRARHEGGERVPPPADYHGHPCDLGRFHWTRRVWHSHERLSSFAEDQWPGLLRRAHTVVRTGDEVEVTFRHEDWYAALADPHIPTAHVRWTPPSSRPRPLRRPD